MAAAALLVVVLASVPLMPGGAELELVAGALVGELAAPLVVGGALSLALVVGELAALVVGGALSLALVVGGEVGLELWAKTLEVQENASKVAMRNAWMCLFIG